MLIFFSRLALGGFLLVALATSNSLAGRYLNKLSIQIAISTFLSTLNRNFNMGIELWVLYSVKRHRYLNTFSYAF